MLAVETATQVVAEAPRLSAGGWVAMVGCISAVCSLCVYCYARVLRGATDEDSGREPLDIDTHGTAD